MATNFRRGAGGSIRRCRRDDHVSVAIHAPHFIGVTVNNIRVIRPNSAAGASGRCDGRRSRCCRRYVAHQTLFSALHFLHPLRLGNQTAANGDRSASPLARKLSSATCGVRILLAWRAMTVVYGMDLNAHRAGRDSASSHPPATSDRFADSGCRSVPQRR